MNQIISWLLEHMGLLSIISSVLTVVFLSLSTFFEYVSLDQFFRTYYYNKKSIIISELVQLLLLSICSAIFPIFILFMTVFITNKDISLDLLIKNKTNFQFCYALIFIWIGFILSLYMYSLKKKDKNEYVFSEYYIFSNDLESQITNLPSDRKLYIQNFFKGKFLLRYSSENSQNISRILVEESKLFNIPIYYNNDINENMNRGFDKIKNCFYFISLIVLGILTSMLTILGVVFIIINN